MTCITIEECDHGTVGVATNYKSAIKFLITKNWLTDDIDIYLDDKDKWVYLIEWRPDWKEYLLSLDIYDFNILFEDKFYLAEYDLFNAAE